MELREGMRVRVVKDDVTGFVGVESVVVRVDGYDYYLLIDGIEYPFGVHELVRVDADNVHVDATVFEGVVSIEDGRAYLDTDDDLTVDSVYGRFVGKRVRVTIEVLNEGGDGA